jgi:hypothetical protein
MTEYSSSLFGGKLFLTTTAFIVSDSRSERQHSSMTVLGFSQRLLRWHAEAQIVPIWISHREFPRPPGLINWSGLNWRLRSLRRVQTPRANHLQTRSCSSA